MVHEWAHLRWGVFDETGGDGYPEFYFDSISGKVEANKQVLYMSLLYYYLNNTFQMNELKFLCSVNNSK